MLGDGVIDSMRDVGHLTGKPIKWQSCYVLSALRRWLTSLLVVKQATVDATWYLVTPIKDDILLGVLVVIPCNTVIVSFQLLFPVALSTKHGQQ